MSPSLSRSEVRKRGRAARQAIDGVARNSATNALISHLQNLQVMDDARSVGVFVADDGEPDLTPLVQWLWDQGSQVALPVLLDDPADHSMRFVPWESTDILTPARYGIPVPPAQPAIEPDLLLVSFVGFDSDGHRMGRGGGFFDRYLEGSAATVVGVGFEAQRFDSVPVEAHDQVLPTVVTDLGVRFLQH